MSVRVLRGDVFATLPTLPSQSIHCCVTSPPYWALRSYLKADDPLKPLELGSEATPDDHVARMVDVFREVKRVLRDDGLCWVNYGDSYASGNGMERPGSGKVDGFGANRNGCPTCPGLSPLQRVGIPERFALAMQADGWIWRDTIVWHKKSPMPASLSGTSWQRCRVKVASKRPPTQTSKMNHAGGTACNRDCIGGEWQGGTQWSDCPGCPRCQSTGGYVLRRGSWRTTPAHEYIFMFAKQAGYFSDQEAVKEPCAASTLKREKYTRILDDPDEQFAVAHDHESISGGKRNPRSVMEYPRDFLSEFSAIASAHDSGNAEALQAAVAVWEESHGLRSPGGSVMSFKAHNLKEKHYAAFPPGLPEFCIKASTSEKGCCPNCGAQWARVVDKPSLPHVEPSELDRFGDGTAGVHRKVGQAYQDWRAANPDKTTGWRPTCACSPADPIPASVLDPFGGSGTTGLVADRLGRHAILCELNPEYAQMARKRITKDAGMFAEVEVA